MRKRAIGEDRFETVYRPIPPPDEPDQNTWSQRQVMAALQAEWIGHDQVWALNDGEHGDCYAVAGFGSSNFVVSTYVVTVKPWANEDDFALWISRRDR